MSRVLRLGTRRSPLALHQAREARERIQAARPDLDVELVEIVSDGDTDPRELRDIDDRGMFAAALERALRRGDIDAAVHSSKDVTLDDGGADMVLAAWLPRRDARDALVGATAPLRALPAHARIATGSARRSSLLRTAREDLTPAPIRGNVRTRMERATERGDAGLLLALAGLERLGLVDEPATSIKPLAVDVFVPDAGQGAVVVQTLQRTCPSTGFVWSMIDHTPTHRAVALERRLAEHLGGGCTHPVGVHAQLHTGRVHAFVAPSAGDVGTHATLQVVGLELGTLVSVTDPADIDDAAAWTCEQLLGQLSDLLATNAERR